MTGRLPTVTPRETIRALEKAGWHVHRQRGSHAILHKPGSQRIVVVPLHSHDLPRGTLRGILEDAELTDEEFFSLLRD